MVQPDDLHYETTITHKSKHESKCNCKEIWNFIQVFCKWCLTYLPIVWVSRTLKAVMLPWLEIISKYFFFFNLPIISQMWKLFRYCLSKDAFSTECLKWIEYLKSTLGILFWKFWFTLTIQNICVIWFVDIIFPQNHDTFKQIFYLYIFEFLHFQRIEHVPTLPFSEPIWNQHPLIIL